MVNESDRSVCGQGCDVERGQCGVASAEIAERGSETLHASPHVYARRGSREETPLPASASLRRPVERHVRPDGGGEVLEYAEQVEPLIQRAMTLGALRKAQNDREHIAAGDAQQATWKPVGVFAVGDSVVMTGRALYSSGQRTGRDVARVWTVTECACDLCQTGRFVAVDQWVHEIGWRHIAKASVRHYGQPCVDELSPSSTQEDMGHIARGLQLGWRRYGGGR